MDEQNPVTAPADSGASATPAKTPETPAASPLPGVPASWPGAFGIYKYSKQAVRLNLVTLVVLWLITVIVGGGADYTLHNPGNLISFIVDSLVSAAFAMTFIAGVRGQQLPVGEALSKSVPFWLKMIGLNILVMLSLVISFLLLIVPFFFVAPRLSLVTYFLVDKKLGVIEAYKASWEATKGNAVTVWGVIGAALLMAMLALTIIGIPFSIYFLIMYSAAFGVLYEFLGKNQPAVAATPAPAAPAAAPTAPAPPASGPPATPPTV